MKLEIMKKKIIEKAKENIFKAETNNECFLGESKQGFFLGNCEKKTLKCVNLEIEKKVRGN